MKVSHKKAQTMFKDLGEDQGFCYTPTYTQQLPTDGVWWTDSPLMGEEQVPIAAIEVANSEDAKRIKGSLFILAEVSPALGILMVHDVDIRRRLIRDRKTIEEVDRLIKQKTINAENYASRFQQRIEVWTYEQLKSKHDLAIKKRFISLKKFN